MISFSAAQSEQHLRDGDIDAGSAIVQALEDSFFARIQLNVSTLTKMASVIAASGSIFAQKNETQAAFKAPGSRIGHRELGLEYSISASRPDLMESLSFNLAFESGLRKIAIMPEHHRWLDAAGELFVSFDELLTVIVEAIARSCGILEPAERGMLADGSFLQINNYRAEYMIRPELQDAHEDGNLLTFLWADSPGLQIVQDDGRCEDVAHASDQLLVFAGSVMSVLTNDRLRPFVHRVVRKSANDRLSLVYFGNPALNRNFATWWKDASPDIAEQAYANSIRYGLPQTRA